MGTGRLVALAGVLAALLYLVLDSTVLTAQPAPAATSVALAVLALIFGIGSWTARLDGQSARATLLGGLALGAGVYALARLAVL